MENVYTIYKHPRYKIIQKDNRYLMIDLEQNWYSYLCPMLNWFIPIKYTELSYKEFNNLNIFNNGGQNSQGMMAAGIGVTISVLLRSIVGFMDININRIWVVMMFLIGFVGVIALRLSIRNKMNHPVFNKKSKQKVMLIPSFKNIILVVFCYFMILFFSIAPFQMIFDEKKHLRIYILDRCIFYIYYFEHIFNF